MAIPAAKLDPELQKIVEGRHHDPSRCSGDTSRARTPSCACSCRTSSRSRSRTVSCRSRGSRAATSSSGAAPRPGAGALSAHLADDQRREHIGHDPYCYPAQLADFDLHLFGEGRHYHAHGCSARGARGGRRRRRAVLRLGTQRGAGQRGRRLQPLDGRCHPMRARGGGVWELFIPDLAPGALYKFELRATAAACTSSPTLWPALRAAAVDASIVEPADDYRLGRRGLDGAAQGARLAARAHVDLRVAPRLVAARARGRDAQLPRSRAPLGRLRDGHGVQPHRAAAHHRAPLRQVVGLPGHRLLRPDQPVRQPDDFRYFVDHCHRNASA